MIEIEASHFYIPKGCLMTISDKCDIDKNDLIYKEVCHILKNDFHLHPNQVEFIINKTSDRTHIVRKP